MADDADDLEDLLDDNRARLEARFRELEREEELRRMRQSGGQAPPSSPEPETEDPLSDLKSRMASDAGAERYLLVKCPHCDAMNRMSLTRVRVASPLCGRCKKDLAVERF